MSLHPTVGDALEEVLELVQAAGARERFRQLHAIGGGLLERNGVQGWPPPSPIGLALTTPALSTSIMNTLGVVPGGASLARSKTPGAA